MSKVYPDFPLPSQTVLCGTPGTHLGKFIQTEDLPAVVLPAEALARESAETPCHLISRGRHHK